MEQDAKESRLPRVVQPAVTIVGVGGLGSPVAITLAKQEYPLTLYDNDKVELKNVKNQFYTTRDVGEYKVAALHRHLNFLAPDSKDIPKAIKVSRLTTFYTPIVVACVDSLAARTEVFAACRRSLHVKYLVDGRLGGTNVKVLALNPHNDADAEAYTATLEGQVILGCAQQFEGHIALIGAGMVVRAIKMCHEDESVERLVVFETRGLHILKDGPHPLV
jgi:molybdopterin/thiamine biosynthesis adenylyltransferase